MLQKHPAETQPSHLSSVAHKNHMREKLVPKRWEIPEVLREIHEVSVPDKKTLQLLTGNNFSIDVLF